jgi:RecA/RadA recombinase
MAPRYTEQSILNIQKLLASKNHLLSLDEPQKIEVISSNCPTFDWMTDCGGIPRGRIIEISGLESSGKCVTLDSTVSIPEEGIFTIEELLESNGTPAKDLANSQIVALHRNPLVTSTNEESTHSNGIYFAGLTENTTVYTESGNVLTGTNNHRVLTLPSNGILRWTALEDLRPQDLLVTGYNHKVEGKLSRLYDIDLPTTKTPTQKEVYGVRFLALLSTVELRSGRPNFIYSLPTAMKLFNIYAEELYDGFAFTDINEREFTAFSGIATIKEGQATNLALLASSEKTLNSMRKSSITAQMEFLTTLFVTKGIWTDNDLELEIQSSYIARLLKDIGENLGVKLYFYESINTFSEKRYKLALYDYEAQQNLKALIESSTIPHKIPSTWKDKFVVELPEMPNRVMETLRRASEIHEKVEMAQSSGGLLQKTEICTSDTEKDNLLYVANLIRLHCKNQSSVRVYETLLLLASPNVRLETVINTHRNQYLQKTADLSMPIGHHYATNGIISHNSTLCMHLAQQELTANKSSTVFYQDFERSTAVNYARKMGLHKHKTDNGMARFVLVPSDTIEDADDLVKDVFKMGVVPSIWICDSVPAMVPKDLFNRDSDDSPPVALQARKMSDLLSRWVKLAADYGTSFILVNQVRAFISTGFMDKGRGVPGIAGSEKETTPGGNAVKFYASMRIDLRPKNTIKAKTYNPMTGEIEDTPIANLVKATVRKNKCGNPFRSSVFYITYGEGIDVARTMLELALQKQIVVKESSGLSLKMSDGSVLTAPTQDKFITELKSGPQSAKASQFLQEALQWNQADDFSQDFMGTETLDSETGETISSLSYDNEVAITGKLKMVRMQNDPVIQADILGLLTKSGKAITWKNPTTGEEFRGGNSESLSKKLKAADRSALSQLVVAKIKTMEEFLKTEKDKLQSLGSLEPQVSNPTTTSSQSETVVTP